MAQNNNVDNQSVGNTTVGSLEKTMSNEDRSLSTPKNGDPKELEKGKDALANAIINNAELDHPAGCPTSRKKREKWAPSSFVGSQRIFLTPADVGHPPAAASDGSKPGKYFFIRQEGVGPQEPSAKAGFGQGDPIHEYGPFRNAGGGDVPKGNRTYVDIYNQ